jgi:hypothetical protein
MIDWLLNYFLPNDPANIPWGAIFIICVVIGLAPQCHCDHSSRAE